MVDIHTNQMSNFHKTVEWKPMKKSRTTATISISIRL